VRGIMEVGAPADRVQHADDAVKHTEP
jgi:hypothetical protein